MAALGWRFLTRLLLPLSKPQVRKLGGLHKGSIQHKCCWASGVPRTAGDAKQALWGQLGSTCLTPHAE